MQTVEYINNFVEELKKKDRSPSTIIAYKKDIEQLYEFLNFELIHAQTDDIEKFVRKLISDESYSLKTVSRKINSYKTFFKFLHKEKLIEANIADPIEHPDFEKKEARILSPIEYMALRDKARENDRIYTIVELMLQTGVRIGEISRFKLDDLDFKSQLLFVRAHASSPARSIHLNNISVTALKNWIKKRPKQNDKGYLFPTKTGNPILVRNIRSTINRIFKDVGIENATVNDIRNTFIKYQLEKGVKIEKVAEAVGHQRITSTEKYLELLSSSYEVKYDKIQDL